MLLNISIQKKDAHSKLKGRTYFRCMAAVSNGLCVMWFFWTISSCKCFWSLKSFYLKKKIVLNSVCIQICISRLRLIRLALYLFPSCFQSYDLDYGEIEEFQGFKSDLQLRDVLERQIYGKGNATYCYIQKGVLNFVILYENTC